jgi:glycosyltransferase involved in cell wall biosynthesis
MDVKRVLYLSYDGMTDPLGQSQVLPYLKGLSKLGYQVTLVSFEKKEKFLKDKGLIQGLCNETGIVWAPLGYTKKPPVLSTLKDFTNLKKKLKALHASTPFEVVHCRSYITALAGVWMKKKWNVKMVFDMRGFWADERKEGNIWNLKNPLYRTIYSYFKKKEKEFFTHSDYIISLTDNAKKIIESWDKQKQFAPIETIPCCADLNLFNPSAISKDAILEVKKKLDLKPGQQIISYIGSVGTWYMINEMLDFFRVFLAKNTDAVFLFITKEPKAEIEKNILAKQIPLSATRIVAAERDQMPLLISISNFSIFFIRPTFSKKASSPTKQAEIMAMGIPVICNDSVGDTSAIVNTCNAGIVITDFSEQGYEEAIRKLLAANFDSAGIRKGAEEYYSLENGIKKYSCVYEKILR